MTLMDIARLIGAGTEGVEDLEIHRVAKIEDATDGDITFVANPKYARFLSTTRASAVIIGRDVQFARGAEDRPALLRVDDPYVSFLRVMEKIHPQQDPFPAGIHPTAVIGVTSHLGRDVRIGAHTVIGERSCVGDGAVLGHGVIVGDNVTVGDQVILYHHVVVQTGCSIGRRSVIHAGTIIGSDGFGFAPKPDGSYEKIPQMGTVVIEEDVEIGANCTVDRATLGETRIKRGAKLDNLIQVAHNVVIGEHTVIAAQTGISGSTKIGRNVMIGGQAGFVGHLEIADSTKIGAQSGIIRSIEEPGRTYFGYPAVPHRESLRMHAALKQLPDLLAVIRQLRESVERIESRLKQFSEESSGTAERRPSQ